MVSLHRWVVAALLLTAGTCTAHPNHASDSLSVPANRAYSEGRWKDCAHFYSVAIEHGASDPATLYNCACCYALAGDADRAFAWLDSAIAHDFTNVQHLERDADLTALHSDLRWPSLVAKMRLAQQAYLEREGINAELFFMMKEDQAARQLSAREARWDSIAQRDTARLTRVKEMVEAGELRASQDFFNAALIAQHGTDSSDYRLAHELALEAVRLDSTYGVAKWLAAAALDRYLQSIGRPQVYGTQFRPDSTGRWTLEPIDTTAVTDEERARWNVPSLGEARARAAQMNEQQP